MISLHARESNPRLQLKRLGISENTGKFLLRDLAALTNSIYCNSQRGTLMNRFPVTMTPIGSKEFPTIF